MMPEKLKQDDPEAPSKFQADHQLLARLEKLIVDGAFVKTDAHYMPMAKAGLTAMTQSLAVEWGGRGIRLNAIAPGLFPTEGMTARLDPNGTTFNPNEANPMGRTGRPHELANMALYLLATGSEYVNGQTIAIDGAQYQATGGNFANLRSWDDAQWAQARSAIGKTDKAERGATAPPR